MSDQESLWSLHARAARASSDGRGTGVGGASCGGNNSVQMARRHPEVTFFVLLSGSTDLNGREFLRHSATVPVFFSVADDDQFPPTVQAIEWLYSLISNRRKRFV